jgi:mRNA-degrading endonuclease RelE of RelBE toxin-antitoxin system
MPENHPVFKMDDFDRKMEWLRRKVDNSLADRIEKTISQKIAEDPERATKRLQAQTLKPQRTLRIGDWRLFFIYCKECRNENYTQKWNCPNCKDIPEEALVLVDLEKRSDAY